MSDRSRKWCGTLNNWTDEEHAQLLNWCKSETVKFIIGQEEGEEGTPHLQFFIEAKNALRLSTLKKVCGRAHFEVAKGSSMDNYKYCSKEECFDYEPQDLKLWEEKPGKRSDIEHAKELAKTGGMREVVETLNNYQAWRAAEMYLKYAENKRTWAPVVKWFYGPPGTGKTRRAHEEAATLAATGAATLAATGGATLAVTGRVALYVHSNTGKWWDGYDGENIVIIDDFRASDWALNYLLKVLDRYECRVETKGGSRQLLATHIYITSPYHPEAAYCNSENVKQLTRRISEIVEFKLDTDTEVGGNTDPNPCAKTD